MNDSMKTQLVRDKDYGFYRVPAAGHSSYREFYEKNFYEEEKPEYLKKNAREKNYWELIWKLRLDLIESELNGIPGRILDIGASGGFYLDYARARGWQVAGIEPGENAVDFARDNYGIELYQGFWEDYEHHGEPFSAINAAFVLEHVPDPKAFLAKVFRTLKPGGLFWVEVPNDFNSLQAIVVEQLRKTPWWIVPAHHLNYFDFFSLERLLTGMGFEVVEKVASFPLEVFVLMGMDYVGNEKMGGEVHRMRINMESNIIQQNPELLLEMYRNFAGMGIGRTCNFLVRKPV